MNERWKHLTEDQIRAITETGANLIVSSAAGAGKTTVLVERFIHLVTDAQPSAEVDQVLAVTFTEAAAAQLRARIGDALRQKWRNTGEQRLARQILLLDKASISTIHSFCLEVVRQNFHRLGLDPGFTIVDEAESDIMKREVLDDLFESRYGDEGSSLFRDLVSRYGGSGLDQSLKEIVLKIHQFLLTIPDRERWVEEQRRAGNEAGAGMDGLAIWRDRFRAFLRVKIEDLLEALYLAGRTLPQDSSVGKQREYVEGLRGIAREWITMLDGEDVDRVLAAIREFKKGTRPAVKKAAGSWVVAWSDTIDRAQEKLKRLQSDLAGRSWVELEREIEETAPSAAQVLGLANEFETAYAQAKAEHALLDFNDLEWKCLDLLWDRESNGPTDVAKTLRDRFEHVLVDEYQDTNRVQDQILKLVSRQDGDEAPNLFVVGDVKQSIYRFRQAEPEVFLERYDGSSPSADASDRRIDLPKNFRSRRGIIEAINAIFENLMRGEESEISYEEAARLQCGADYEAAPAGPTSGDSVPVEIHFLAKHVGAEEDSGEEENDIEEWEAAKREALFVATRIRRLFIEGMVVWDPDRKEYRNVRYRDVVILLRAPSHKAFTYGEVLRKTGIPVHSEPATGYFTATEIQDFLSLLRIIDNPLQDIPLAAVLRSPIVGMSEDELVRVRLAARGRDFYRALVAYAEGGSDGSLCEKAGEFLQSLERWRTLARRGPLADLVWALYSETDYPAYVMGLDNGAQRRANLIDLHDRARQFDRFRTQGLRRFLAFIDRILKTEGDIGQPSAMSEAEDAVRILSIHKSKGLEFPVVVLPDLSKHFNEEDLRREVLFDQELGVACSLVDPDLKRRFPSLPRRIVRERLRSRLLAEELRIFYVAMTRAQEHLILSGTVDLEKEPQRWTALAGAVPFKKAGSVIDWLGPVLAGMPEGQSAFTEGTADAEGRRFSIRFHDREELGKWQGQVQEIPREKTAVDRIGALEPLGVGGGEGDARVVLEGLRWEYPWTRSTEIRGKESVTELKRRLDPWEEDTGDGDAHRARVFEQLPDFLCEPSRPGAIGRGLTTHTLLEHLDLDLGLDEDSIHRQMQEMAKRRILSPDDINQVSVERVAVWFRSGLARRMLQEEDTLQREVPFTIRIPASELYSELAEETAGDIVIVQGVIDAVFQERGEYIIVDFKTDRIRSDEVGIRARQYQLQMALYAHAIRSILGKPVREAYLYFLEPGIAHGIDVHAGELR